MNRCETCGNTYDKPLIVVTAGQRHIFDCFECAIHRLAPVCGHCGCRIIGHGVEAIDSYFCCAHCAREAGHPAAADRIA